MIERVVIAGGKTGGHLFPGVAVAEEIRARNPDARIAFVGTRDGLEARVVPELGYELHLVRAARLQGGGLAARLRALLLVPVALWQSWRILRRVRPQVVLGVGGFVSGAALLAAWLTRRPTAIQEQNARAGLTNRVLARLVRVVYLGFTEAGEGLRARRTLSTGNPLRRDVVAGLARAASRRAEADADDAGTLHVLAFGGSQGARFLNERLPAALGRLREHRPEVALHAVHQAGRHGVETTRRRYEERELDDRVRVVAFLDDMPTAYAEADVAVCRAGALTVAELAAVGLPALLVPFPSAAEDHQAHNARLLTEAGAARMVRQEDWEDDDVAGWLAERAGDRAGLRAMGERARERAEPEAARILVDDLEGIAA